MYDDIGIDDAVNIASVLNGSLALHTDEDVREFAIAAKQLVRHIAEQSREIERERARRRALEPDGARLVEGHRLEEGTDGGGRRDFLAGCAVHAGQVLYLLTCVGWHAVRYESNMPHNAPVLYLPLPGLHQEVSSPFPWSALRVAGRIAADMNVPEFANIFALLAVQLRQTDADEALMRGYYEGLHDLEPELLKAAAEHLARTAEWFPKTSEWRAAVEAIRRERIEASGSTCGRLRGLSVASATIRAGSRSKWSRTGDPCAV